MIAHLSGTVIYKDSKHAVIQAGGVGYKVFACERDLEVLRIDEHASLWIHTAVRDDAIDLFGFLLRDSQDIFNLLLSVSGIGPKTALTVLNSAGHEAIRKAVGSGEISYLTAVSGVGKKMAEKIVLELKGKLGVLESEIENGTVIRGGSNQSDIDTIEALKSLGYNHREAKEALEKLPVDTRTKDVGEKIKALLKILN